MPEEAQYFVELTEAKALITTEPYRNTALAIKCLTDISIVDITCDPKQMPSQGSRSFVLGEEPLQNPEKAAVILLTSGTTGPPKGVLHTRRSIYATVKQVQDAWALGPMDLSLNPMATHWIAGLNQLMAVVVAGGCVEICAAVFTSAFVLDAYGKRRCHVLQFTTCSAQRATKIFRRSH